ncbi:MAG TPA: hypothetical protein DCE56_44135 [Cyanobacteria bacterium UBA8553]|nr:hypothetical protein [Cyanobacteria bacterium UBA8553]
MPNFPNYRGELPEVLNPLKLRHYWMLAYWVFFRPTAFHCYLYQANPDVYQLRGYRRFLRTWQVAAYRNVYLMLPIALTLLSLLVGLTVVLYTKGLIQGNTAWVNAIAVTPNGQIAVTASGDRALKVKAPSADSTLKVWDLRWRSEMHMLKGHERSVTAVAVTPDGKRAISGSRDQTLKIWDLRRGTQLHNLKDHKGWITSIVVTPDGKQAISASADKTLKVWDIEQGKQLHNLTGHTDIIWAVALTPDGKRAVSASGDKTLKVWDIQQGKELYTLRGHRAWVTGVALTSDGKQAVSASVDKTLKVWNLQQGKELYTLAGHNDWVTGVAISANGKRALSASADKTLKVWDIGQGKVLKTLTGHTGWVTSVAMVADEKLAVSASGDQTLKIWDIDTGKALHTLIGHHAWVTAIAAIPNAPLILSASFDRYPKLWSLNSGKEQTLLAAQSMKVGLNWGFKIALILVAISAFISVAIALSIGVMAFGIVGTIISSLLIATVGSLGYCAVAIVADRISLEPALQDALGTTHLATSINIIFGVAFGLVIGGAFSLASRKALAIFAAPLLILLVALGVGIMLGSVLTPSISIKGRVFPAIRASQTVGVLFNFLVILGTLRIPFYPIELVLALVARFRGKWHPGLWDELLVLPVPMTSAILRSHLRASELEGLRLVAEVARNPFERDRIQQALHNYLHKCDSPLHFLYFLLTCPDLDTYVIAPVNQQDWMLLPTTRQVLLGELASTWVDCSSDWLNQLAERWVWNLTWFRRTHSKTHLTDFALMLYQLLYEKAIDAENFDLSRYTKTYNNLTNYPGGLEIAQSFKAMSTFLSYDNLSALSQAESIVFTLTPDENSIRPTVLTALTRLGEVGREVSTYQGTTSQVNQLASLVRAISTLDTLDEYVVNKVLVPEQTLLRRIIHQWRRLISQEANHLACR